MYLSCSITCWSEHTCRNGDCSNCTRRACLRASLKTGSPVVLEKSPRTIVSFWVSLRNYLDRTYRYAVIEATTKITAASVDQDWRSLGSFDLPRDCFRRINASRSSAADW